MQLKVQFKKLHPEAKIPVKSTELAGGYDLFAVEEKMEATPTGAIMSYKTGLAIKIPSNYVGLIFPRSSIVSKTTLMLSNSVGVIDADYTGEVTFKFRNIAPSGAKKYNVGDRVGQLLLIPRFELDFEEVENLDETKRGSGSYGSTGA